MRVTLVALKPTFYHRVGEQFEASEMYAKLVTRLGVARPAEVDEPPETAVPARRKRTYKRRDMTADE